MASLLSLKLGDLISVHEVLIRLSGEILLHLIQFPPKRLDLPLGSVSLGLRQLHIPYHRLILGNQLSVLGRQGLDALAAVRGETGEIYLRARGGLAFVVVEFPLQSFHFGFVLPDSRAILLDQGIELIDAKPAIGTKRV